MPHLLSLKSLALFVPIVATILVIGNYIPRLDVIKAVASSPLFSWPLATHPDLSQTIQQPIDLQEPSYHHGEAYAEDEELVLEGVTPTFERKIVAVGDLHGDLPNALKVLQMAGVVDKGGHWSGNVDFFVQTGDIIDRGDDTLKLYALMDRLRVQAHAVGGTVLTHLGNHEWMNVIGDWRYVRPTEIETFGSASERTRALAHGPLGKSWAANYTTASRLPLHPSLGPPNTDYVPSHPASASALSHAALSFVHGGLAPTYPDLTPFPSRINALSTSLLHKLQHQHPLPAPHPPHAYPGLPHSATQEEHRLYGADGPLWYRGWALDPEEKVCREVGHVLEKTGTRRMIMGHTPDFERIVARCHGKIIIIDTGISHAYGGALSALSIKYTLTPVADASEDGEQRWVEKEVVTAVYPHRQEILAVDVREVAGDFGA